MPGLLEKAAAGELPAWVEAGPERRAHLARVAGLLESWARRLGLERSERVRWRAAGWLHDALRDAPPTALRDLAPPELRELPAPLLHGPAMAERLRADGVDDQELLVAVAYHTLGHPAFGRLGRALYLADFLEPGRSFDPVRRAALRARLPVALESVLVEVVAARVCHLLAARRAVRSETLAFWNAIARGS